QLWYLPLAIRATTDDGSKESFFALTQSEQSFYIGENISSLVLNADGKGFYRVSYSNDLREQLLLHLPELSNSERFNLVSDLWAATQAGDLSLAGYFDALKRIMPTESDSNVCSVVLSSIAYLRRICAAGNPQKFSDFIGLSKGLLEPALNRLGWEAKAGETPQEAELRSSLISTLGTLGDPEVRNKVKELWAKYLADRSSVSTNLLPALVDTTAAHGDAACYEEFIKLKVSASTPQEETRFLFALASFRKLDLIERTLDATLNGTIRVQDGPQMVRALFLNPAGGLATWSFVRKNWKQLVAAFPLQGIIRLCEGITGLVNPELEPELKDFFAANNIKGNEKALAQNMETLAIANRFLVRERSFF
ncbi:MAG: ERAP1-like C-terminal domain-containing protein, partial [Candidatus Obscuribacterales bacterium]|nr:ERAP1-like C-terminal domain-containing protein [Candidatus Obscuribacterales bacterium]